MKGQDVKYWEVYKGKEIPDERDPKQREEKEQNLEQEHKEKRLNSVFFCEELPPQVSL